APTAPVPAARAPAAPERGRRRSWSWPRPSGDERHPPLVAAGAGPPQPPLVRGGEELGQGDDVVAGERRRELLQREQAGDVDVERLALARDAGEEALGQPVLHAQLLGAGDQAGARCRAE